MPNSPWAGELGGSTVAGGSAANPLKARWMGITDGVGIHGTGDDYSIGSAASHGCIRMHVADVKRLYPLVPVGTTDPHPLSRRRRVGGGAAEISASVPADRCGIP